MRKPDSDLPAKVKVEGLGNVAKTLLIPLYLRALESSRPDALLNDSKAVELVNQLDYDFSRLSPTAFSRVFPLMRMREFDRRVRAFLNKFPQANVVDIGCGLDTRFFRVGNGMVNWHELDLPEVMAIRDKLLGETPRRHSIGCSALDFTWMDKIHIHDGQPLLFLAEGVFPYFELDEVKCLLIALTQRFPGSELIFDALPPGFVRWMRWHPALRATNARLSWGLTQAAEPEQWHPGIRNIDEWYYFDQPEPRLRWYRFLKWFTPISKTRIVQYRLGELASDLTASSLSYR